MADKKEGKPPDRPLGQVIEELWSYSYTDQRAHTLIDVAKIDDYMLRVLFSLVKVELTRGEYRSLFEAKGLFGSADARREALYAFGLIDKRANKAIECLLRIRNEFAHRPEVSSLSHHRLQGHLSELKKLLPNEDLDLVRLSTDMNEKRRLIYSCSVRWISLSLIPRLLEVPDLHSDDQFEGDEATLPAS